MKRNTKVALIGAGGLVVAVGAAVLSGAFDDLLRRSVGEPTPQQATAPAEPATPAAPAPTDAELVERIVPVFDIVRVEPTGDAVIAGQGTPDGEVEILSGADVIARGRISPTGEWAIVLQDPLKAGAHDLTVRTRGTDGSELRSEQSVAVEVPEGGSGEVLVVVNRPGAPSEVLQVPTAEAVDGAVALAEGAAAPTATAPPAPGAQPAVEQPATVAEAPAATAPEALAATAPEAPAATAPEAAGSSTSVTPAPGEPATVPATAPTAPGTDVAASTPPTTAPTTATPSVPAEPQAPGDVATQQPPAEEGGHTVVVQAPLPEGAEGETPAAPAEVAQQAPVVQAPVVQVPAPVAEPSGQAATEAPAAAPSAAPAPVVSVEAVELENGDRFFAAGAAAPGAVLRVYVDDALAGEIKAMDTGRWLLDARLPLAPGAHSVRVDHVQPDGSVVARAGVPFDIAAAEVAVVTVEGSGEGSVAAGTGISGEARIGESKTMIIRRGDNLWQIARRLYGQGVRYSTIYAANTDQIGDPDMIYPGQVFVIPEGDRNWQPSDPAPPAAVN